MSREVALELPCCSDTLIGVLHHGRSDASVGVVVVVGGPQYRVGSHRQFVLLARALAGTGIPVLRFDYRGMGDSTGQQHKFDEVDDDIKSAVDALCETVTTLKSIVIWGLCDAASAALFYAHKDPRVAGLVLLNPWVRTDAGMARAYLKHYYLRRLFSMEFWRKALSGQWSVRASLASITGLAMKLRKSQFAIDASASEKKTGTTIDRVREPPSLPEAMLDGWGRFNGKILLILSGNNDYVADEFRDLINASRRWRKAVNRPGTTRRDFPQANHTFSRSDWRDQVAEWTSVWLSNNL